MTWLEPWSELLESQKMAFLNELNREIIVTHPLFDLKLKIIGRNMGSDDIICQVDDGRLVIVHLTWSKENSNLYPTFKFYKNWFEFEERRMKIDYLEYKE